MKLTERREQVKQLRLVEKKTLEETAEILDITPQRVWQIEQDLRYMACEKHIEEEVAYIQLLKRNFKKTKTIYLKQAYQDKIDEAINEIKYYCSYKLLDFNKIKEKYGL